MSTAALKNVGRQYAQQHGLQIVASHMGAVAGKTCTLIVRKGVLVVELHTELAANQTAVRSATGEA